MSIPHVTRWATANYPAGSDPWSATPTAVSPVTLYWTPGAGLPAQELNYELNYVTGQLQAMYTAQAAAALGNWKYPTTGLAIANQAYAGAIQGRIAGVCFEPHTQTFLVQVNVLDSSSVAQMITMQTHDGMAWSQLGTVNPHSVALCIVAREESTSSGYYFFTNATGTCGLYVQDTTGSPMSVHGQAALNGCTVVGSFFLPDGSGGGKYYAFGAVASGGTSIKGISATDPTSATWTTLTLPSGLATMAAATSMTDIISARSAALGDALVATVDVTAAKLFAVNTAAVITDLSTSLPSGYFVTGLTRSDDDSLWIANMTSASTGYSRIYTSPTGSTWTLVHDYLFTSAHGIASISSAYVSACTFDPGAAPFWPVISTDIKSGTIRKGSGQVANSALVRAVAGGGGAVIWSRDSFAATLWAPFADAPANF